ncbi:MAG: chromosomal replication initiator protein DnaA [Prevotellaceae bacterium]|nr:chromosomal replication initiator protein DnaA [Prevotellaceae bacterium]
MKAGPDARWDKALAQIRENVTEQIYKTWFKPIVFEHFDDASKVILVQVPSAFVYEYLEENFVELMGKVLHHCFGAGIKLSYRIVTDKEHNLSQDIETDATDAVSKTADAGKGAQTSKKGNDKQPQELDSQLDPHRTFSNYIEGESNKLSRSVGLSIAEHPNTMQFNPMFIYGPSGCGKTHLLNAIGLHCKQLYPQKRVLYISARLFQVQYTNAYLHGTINDFIAFYQTIDMLIVDDIQEWVTAAKTQDTFFHIFNHLFRNGKRIILASDRPPVDLKGMHDRLLTRFSCGLIAELEKPNKQLCADILVNKIHRDGLKIPADVIDFIASTASGSVRDLEGVVSSLMAYSIVYNCNIDMRLAERVVKRAVKMDDKPLTVDDILEKVCVHYNVTTAQINSKSRKRDYVVARQVSMYLAQKYTKMPASRIGRLVGNRDHSTVIHSCAQVEKRLQVDKAFKADIVSIETSFKLKEQ